MTGEDGPSRCCRWLRSVAFLLPCLLSVGVSYAAELETGEACGRRLDRAIELLDSGDSQGAIKTLRGAKDLCGKERVGLFTTLISAHSEYRQLLPNHTAAGRRARRLLERAAHSSRLEEIPRSSLQEVVDRIRRHVAERGNRPDGSLLGPFLCNLRMLSRDTATDGEPVVTGGRDVEVPTRIFTPFPSFYDPVRQKTVEATYVVKLTIDSEGCPASATVLVGSGERAEREVLSIVRWWSYEPVRLPEGPTAVAFHVTVRMILA